MAIILAQQRKNKKTLIIVLIVIVLITAIILWQGLLNKKSKEVLIVPLQEEINIDFNILKNPSLKDLQTFPEIEPLEESTTTIKGKIQTTGQKGKENPFSP